MKGRRRSVVVTNDSVIISERLVASAAPTLLLPRDEKLNTRLPEPLKAELESEFAAAGFSNLSDYVVCILALRREILASRKQ